MQSTLLNVMIDIHTHILPFSDDGAETMEDSLFELNNLSQAGITDVILTPHYIRKVFDNTYLSNIQKLNELKERLLEKGININLRHGSEVFLDDNIWEDIEQHKLCISNTKYVLVETCFTGFPSNILDILYQLVRKGYKPILAHPERYYDIVNNKSIAEDLIYRDVYLQLNAGSVLGYYGDQVKDTAWWLIKNKFIHFIASDTHCNRDYYFLNEALQTVSKHFGLDFIDIITRRNPALLLANQEIKYLN